MPDNPNTRLTAYIVGGIVLAIALGIAWDLYIRHPQHLDCGDGPRSTIDTRQFATQYTAYSVQLEGSLNDKAKLSLKLDPVQQEKLTEALQSANEFRKYVVAGFNSCAITKAQYGRLGARFHTLDGLAQQIKTLASQASRSSAQDAQLTTLVNEYATLAHNLGTDTD